MFISNQGRECYKSSQLYLQINTNLLEIWACSTTWGEAYTNRDN